MIDWLAVARAVHVVAIVHWIGGLLFVTLVILPSLLETEAPRRLALFDALERRFATQARVSTLLVGLSGFYMLNSYEQWGRIADPRFWWLDAMIGLWAIFTVMLFIVEPMFLHAWFNARPAQSRRRVSRGVARTSGLECGRRRNCHGRGRRCTWIVLNHKTTSDCTPLTAGARRV